MNYRGGVIRAGGGGGVLGVYSPQFCPLFLLKGGGLSKKKSMLQSTQNIQVKQINVIMHCICEGSGTTPLSPYTYVNVLPGAPVLTSFIRSKGNANGVFTINTTFIIQYF